METQKGLDAYQFFDNGVPIPEIARLIWSETADAGTRWLNPSATTGLHSFYLYLLEDIDNRTPPINRIAAQAPGAYYHVHKELLRRRGVIRTAVVRHPAGPPLDSPTRRELDAAISELYGLGS